MQLCYSRYLLNCDFFYKHNSQNIFSIVKINRLTVKANLDFLSKLLHVFSIKKISNSEVISNTFLFFYFNYNTNPYINYIKKNESYLFKLTLLKKNLYSFLFEYLRIEYYMLMNILISCKFNSLNLKRLVFEKNFLTLKNFQTNANLIYDARNLKDLSYKIGLTIA
jgi:hypothetical protein